MGAHCYEAKRAGVDVVWLTDHDTRISLSIGGPFIESFDFESPDLTTAVDRLKNGGRPGRIGVGWQILRQDPGVTGGASLSKNHFYRGTQSLCLDDASAAEVGSSLAAPIATQRSNSDPDDWHYLILDFKADSKMHSRPLFAGARVGVATLLECLDDPSGQDAEAWLDLILTEQPPDLRQARLRYLIAGDPSTHTPEDEDRYHTRVLPLHSSSTASNHLAQPGSPRHGAPNQNNSPTHAAWLYRQLDPAADAAGELGGTDNSMNSLRLGVRVRRAGRIRLYVDDLSITHDAAGNALHARQRAIAKEKAATYGVTCHVAQEISWAGQHKNAWGVQIPLMDYASSPGGFTHAEGVDWAKRHGAAFSLNHPFSKFEYKSPDDDAAREAHLALIAEEYVTHQAYGANCLEVGFPAGRHHFPLDYYLRLWDTLSAAGVVIAGSGSSDAHSARVGWQTGNNYATHIHSSSTDEDSLLAGIRSRNLYPADPILFRSRLDFRDTAGHVMGEVVHLDVASAGSVAGSDLSPLEAILTLEAAQPHWHLVWVVNGQRQTAIKLPSGMTAQRIAVPTPAAKNGPTWVRAEIWDPTHAPEGPALPEPVNDPLQGRCISLLNPIWYFAG